MRTELLDFLLWLYNNEYLEDLFFAELEPVLDQYLEAEAHFEGLR